MKTILDIGVLVVTLLIMLVVGRGLEKRHFDAVVRRKGTVVLTLTAQLITLPQLGFAVARLMALPPHLSAGILLLAACPIGDIANFYALVARANVALAVTLNILSCLLSVATMALVVKIYELLLTDRFVLSVPPPTLALRLTLMVALPVLAGMMIRRFKLVFVERQAKTLQNLSIAGLIFLVVYVLMTQRQYLAAGWRETAVAGAAFMLLAMLCGLVFGRLLKLPAADMATVAITFAVRNVALAMAIAVTLLNRTEYAAFAVVYFLTEVPMLLGSVVAYRRWISRGRLSLSSSGGTLAYYSLSAKRGPQRENRQ